MQPGKKNTKIQKFRQFAFTLIELLVVISIIGFISSVAFVSLQKARLKARDAKRISDLQQIKTALELYYEDNGFYPQSPCGWDCNDYFRSSDATWTTFATALAPYLPVLPKDPFKNNCDPWTAVGCYSYTYGNVGRTTYKPQYDLTAQLEDPNSEYRCAVKQYMFFWGAGQLWCGAYPGQIYEASPM